MLLRVRYFEVFILFDLSYWVVDCHYPVSFIFIKNTLPAVLYIVICSFTIFAKFKILRIFLLYTKIRTMYGISKSQILRNNRSSFVGVMPHLTTSVTLDSTFTTSSSIKFGFSVLENVFLFHGKDHGTFLRFCFKDSSNQKFTSAVNILSACACNVLAIIPHLNIVFPNVNAHVNSDKFLQCVLQNH